MFHKYSIEYLSLGSLLLGLLSSCSLLKEKARCKCLLLKKIPSFEGKYFVKPQTGVPCTGQSLHNLRSPPQPQGWALCSCCRCCCCRCCRLFTWYFLMVWNVGGSTMTWSSVVVDFTNVIYHFLRENQYLWTKLTKIHSIACTKKYFIFYLINVVELSQGFPSWGFDTLL